jgi:hypothetical protein
VTACSRTAFSGFCSVCFFILKMETALSSEKSEESGKLRPLLRGHGGKASRGSGCCLSIRRLRHTLCLDPAGYQGVPPRTAQPELPACVLTALVPQATPEVSTPREFTATAQFSFKRCIPLAGAFLRPPALYPVSQSGVPTANLSPRARLSSFRTFLVSITPLTLIPAY